MNPREILQFYRIPYKIQYRKWANEHDLTIWIAI